jgi:hypothetical protein
MIIGLGKQTGTSHIRYPYKAGDYGMCIRGSGGVRKSVTRASVGACLGAGGSVAFPLKVKLREVAVD